MVFFVVDVFWRAKSSQRWVTYTGEESLLIRVSPVVDTALKFRGQLDFRLVVLVDTGQQKVTVVAKQWDSLKGNSIRSKSNPKPTYSFDNPT